MASAEAGPGERWAGPGEKWVGPALWGRGQDDPPTHTQVEELSGQRAAAALQVERWQRECRSLQERFEALSQEREVRPPSPRPPPPPGPPTPPPTSPLVSCPCSRGCWRSAMLCARPTRSCAVLRCSRAACSRQVSGGPKGGGRGGTAPIRVAAPIKVPVPIRVTVIFLLFVILDSVVSTVAATAMPGTPPRGCHVVCVCVCPPLKLKPYFSPLDALLDGSAAPAGNLAAEILPAELRWVPGGVLEPQCCPTCPDPPPLFHPPPGRQWHGCSRRTSGCRPRRQHYGCRGTDCSSSSVTLTGMGETEGGVPITPLPRSPFPPL